MNRLLLAVSLSFALAGCGEGEADRTANASASAAPRALVGEQARTLPALTGRVVDRANILSAATETELGSRLAALEAKTSDQLVVVTVPTLNGETIDDFGQRLGNGWGVGQGKLDNGVLLIVAHNDRVTRISVGSGLEGLLTYPRTRQIVERVVVHFRDDDYDAGVKTGVEEIIRTLESEKKRPMPLDLSKVA